MLYGVDISNWQSDLKLKNIFSKIDFVICKATEGINFVDKYCDTWIQDAIKLDLLWGFYHFARNNDPEKEALFFYENCKNYFGKGIPVLDIESSSIESWGRYAQIFTDKVHALSGVYPIVYTSAAYLSRFAHTTVPKNCGLWIAGYPSNDKATFQPEKKLPYSIKPWNIVAMWQFTSKGQVEGYDNFLDLDYAYMDSKAWKKYAICDIVDNVDKVTGNTQPIPYVNETHKFEDDKMMVTITMK